MTSRDGMRWIPGGEFYMGSDEHYPEEAPVHKVHVDGFFMDETPVTNDQFGLFVEDTGYVTFAEIAPRAEDYPGADISALVAGSLVFVPPCVPVAKQIENWWEFLHGANWRHPYGPASNLDGLGAHPVVHVAWCDVEAYAAWANKSLPTEAEWERAARGGLDRQAYAWGNAFTLDGRLMANTWHGQFPNQNLALDGFRRTSPVGSFPANDYGLLDMIGNVWEWTQDWFKRGHDAHPGKSCCTPTNPRGANQEESIDARAAGLPTPRKVLKGGSHLCAPNYCQRYRPAARHAHPVDTSTSHIGFRCVWRPSDSSTSSCASASERG